MPQDKEIPLNLVKRISIEKQNKLLNSMREFLKNDKSTQNLFKEYGASIEEIDFIPMRFEDLDVSAKTSKGTLIFNYNLLQDGDFFKDFSYGAHEIVHFLQQTCGTEPTKSSDDDDYLMSKNEQEGFQHQIEFIGKYHGSDSAEQYVDDLLDYHEPDEKDRKKLKNTLLNKI